MTTATIGSKKAVQRDVALDENIAAPEKALREGELMPEFAEHSTGTVAHAAAAEASKQRAAALHKEYQNRGLGLCG